MTWADLVIAIAAVLALIFSLAANNTAKKALQQDALSKLMFEYRTAEMLVAVQALWDFKRAHGDEIAEAYEKVRAEDELSINKLPASEQTDKKCSTLHYRRRLVSQFYALLAGLYDLRILSPQLTFTFWTQGDLRIIEEVIAPIERRLAYVLETSRAGDTPSLRRMLKLYEDSKSYSPVPPPEAKKTPDAIVRPVHGRAAFSSVPPVLRRLVSGRVLLRALLGFFVGAVPLYVAYRVVCQSAKSSDDVTESLTLFEKDFSQALPVNLLPACCSTAQFEPIVRFLKDKPQPIVESVAESIYARDSSSLQSLLLLGVAELRPRTLEGEQEALRLFSRAVGLWPKAAEARFFQGIALRALGLHDSALRDFSRAVDLEPDYARAHAMVGLTLAESAKTVRRSLGSRPGVCRALDEKAAGQYTQALEGSHGLVLDDPLRAQTKVHLWATRRTLGELDQPPRRLTVIFWVALAFLMGLNVIKATLDAESTLKGKSEDSDHFHAPESRRECTLDK